jgi:hypothetical protein
MQEKNIAQTISARLETQMSTTQPYYNSTFFITTLPFTLNDTQTTEKTNHGFSTTRIL